MRTLPATVASFVPNAARRSANGRSPRGWLMTIPMAPLPSCCTIRITARSKRVSRIAGVAIRSWPLSEGGACSSAAAGPARFADTTMRARIKGRTVTDGMGRSAKLKAEYRDASIPARGCGCAAPVARFNEPLTSSKPVGPAFGVALGNVFKRLHGQDDNSAPFKPDPSLSFPNAQLPVCALPRHADDAGEILLGDGDLSLALAPVAFGQAQER